MDATIQYLIDLNGQIMEMGSGYWVKIEARQVPPSSGRPAGVDYSLCLFSPKDERLLCYDNAHPIKTGSGPAAKLAEKHDHVHKGQRIKPYLYANAATLLEAFWSDVNKILQERGVS